MHVKGAFELPEKALGHPKFKNFDILAASGIFLHKFSNFGWPKAISGCSVAPLTCILDWKPFLRAFQQNNFQVQTPQHLINMPSTKIRNFHHFQQQSPPSGDNWVKNDWNREDTAESPSLALANGEDFSQKLHEGPELWQIQVAPGNRGAY